MSAVELRYAEALLSAAEPDALGAVGASLAEFSTLLSGKNVASEFLLDPTIPTAIKKETAEKLMPEDSLPLIRNFIYILIDKGRLALLPSICEAYKRLDAEYHNSPDIYVYSAQPLDEGQLTEIRDKYRKRYNIPTAAVRLIIDSKLLGGILVQIGDNRIDATLLGRLNGLRQALERK